MTLVPLDIPSGFYRIGTDYEQSGRWREGSLVRWLDGSLRPIGGWQNRKEDFALQPIRGMHAWEALNQSTWLAGGSHNSLVAMTGGGLCYDITPENLATGRIDAAVSAGFGKGAYGVGFWGTPRQQLSNAIPDPATFWTLDNFGELMVGCHYDDGRLVERDLNIVSGSELITNNSFSVGTDWTLGTGWAISGGEAKWTGTTAANLEQAVTGLTSGKKYHFTINVVDPDADADATTIPSLKVKIIGTTTTTVLLDKTLPIGNSFFRFDTDDTGVTIQIYPATNAEQNVNVTETSLKLAVVATPITNAPINNLGLVVTEERFIFALGAGGNSRKVQWCSFEDRNLWAPASTNQAGDTELQTSGQIMQGIRTRGQILILTDVDAFTAVYSGPPEIYRFTRVGTSCGTVTSRGAVDTDKGVFFIGQENFFLFNGNTVQTIKCDVHDYIFGDINTSQQTKIWAMGIPQYGEVWWFYPSANSIEIDRYVAYDYNENHWMIGELSRTSGVERGVFRYPMMADWDTTHANIKEHEVGYNVDNGAIFAETGPISIGNGDQIAKVTSVIPDEVTQGDVNMTFKTRFHPNDTETSHGPFTPANPTDARFSGRQLRMKVQGVRPANWRVGVMRLQTVAGGNR